MKNELSSMELHYLLAEMKSLKQSRISRLHQPGKDELLLQLHKTGLGKSMLRIKGKLMYLTEHKPENPKTPFGFCTFLRKKLSNAVIKDLRQVGSERIADIAIGTRENSYRLFIELFGAGNIILAKEDKTIISPLNIQKFKDRQIRPGVKYSFPEKKHNLFEISQQELSELLKKSGQESLVKALALDLGLGGTYSEELCLLSGLDKSSKPASLSEKQIKELFSCLRKMLSKEPDPRIVLKDSKVIDIVPFEMKKYSGFEQKKKETYNAALDSVITKALLQTEKEKKEKTTNRELEKIKKSLNVQEKNIGKLRKQAEEDQRKGELIYERYSDVKEILDELNKAREKHSWKEIKKRLKGHKTIKEINEKEGKVVIEI